MHADGVASRGVAKARRISVPETRIVSYRIVSLPYRTVSYYGTVVGGKEKKKNFF